jgi:hypothetical protein
MAMVVLWLSAFSAAKANPTLAFSAGIALYLSIYASFTLIPLLLLTPLVAATIWATREKSQRSLQGLAILNSAGAAGFLIMLLLFQVLFHYDILTRFSAALSAHQDIKSWMPGIDYTIAFAFINNVEFACGIGIAIAIVFVDQLAATIIGATQKRIDSAGYLVATVVMALVGLAIFGKVKAESARLWLFLVPLVCVVATNRIVRRFGTNPRHVVLFLLALQLVTTLVLKRYEDFWRPPA